MMLVDGHVHIYGCFDAAAALDAAAANLAMAARELRCDEYDAVLCLVAGERERFLDDVLAARRTRIWRPDGSFWQVDRGDEPGSLVAQCGDARLFLVAGRQVVTRERLEVLAIGTAARVRGGDPIDDTLRAVRNLGAAAVLPWGVGKWLGARGVIVERVLRDFAWRHVALGDNGNRLAHGPEPAAFAAARELRHAVLPGSDPLPLRGEEMRIGGYGFALDAVVDPRRVAASVVAELRARPKPIPFGRRAALRGFVGRQLALIVKGRATPPQTRWA